MKPAVYIKRMYDTPGRDDGTRVLVDRLWPGGVSKRSAALPVWFNEIAPSPALRKWFAHDPARLSEFRRHYRAESLVRGLRQPLGHTTVALRYTAHATEHNLVLADYLRRTGSIARRTASGS